MRGIIEVPEGEETISSVSLNQLIRLVSKKQLWYQPLSWTSEHLGWLECDFVEEAPEVEEPRKKTSLIPDRMPNDLLMLATAETRSQRHVAMTNLLPYELDRACLEFILRAGGRDIHAFLCYVFYEQYEEEDNKLHIRLAYLDQGDVMACRSRLSAKFQPAEAFQWARDPYMLCVLTTLAQQQELHVRPPVNPESLIFTPHLLTSCPFGSGVALFRAEIPYDYLQMVNDANFRSQLEIRVKIYRKEIPFMPPHTFRRRLATVLSTIEPWIDLEEIIYPVNASFAAPVDDEPVSSTDIEKRKRDEIDEEPEREIKRLDSQEFAFSADSTTITITTDEAL